jgi:hypothetical protein
MASKDTDTKRAKRSDRDPQTGRFLPGNPGGPGNPYAARVATYRAALLEAVTPGDLAAIARTLVQAARSGDVAAAKIVFERTLGRPLEADILERLERLEEALQ